MSASKITPEHRGALIERFDSRGLDPRTPRVRSVYGRRRSRTGLRRRREDPGAHAEFAASLAPGAKQRAQADLIPSLYGDDGEPSGE
jgi:hypothetical protein